MQIKTELKVSQVALENGTEFRVGDEFGDGTIVELIVGPELKERIKDWDFVDEYGDVYPYSDVAVEIIIEEDGEGWGTYFTEGGEELMVE